VAVFFGVDVYVWVVEVHGCGHFRQLMPICQIFFCGLFIIRELPLFVLVVSCINVCFLCVSVNVYVYVVCMSDHRKNS